jgi:starch synthase
MTQDFSWSRSANEYDRMYREVVGVKEPTPDAEQVERFSLGQGADPSLKDPGAVTSPPERPAQPASARNDPPRSRNPLSLLRRRSED